MTLMSFRALLAVSLLPLAGVISGCTPQAPERVDLAPEGSPLWFVEIGRESGVTIKQVGGDPIADYIVDTIGTGAAWLDYDNDGDADLYLAQGGNAIGAGRPRPDQLLRNDGGQVHRRPPSKPASATPPGASGSPRPTTTTTVTPTSTC